MVARVEDADGITVRRAAGSGLLAVVAAFALLYAALVLPDHANRITPAAFARLPLEAIAIGAVLLAARGRWGRLTEVALGVAVALALVLKIADIAAFEAFARPFNPVLDLHLLGAAMNLLSGAIGAVAAYALAGLAAISAVGMVGAGAWAMCVAGPFVRALPPRAAMTALVLAAIAGAGLHVAGAGLNPRLPLAAAESARTIRLHAVATYASLEDLARFTELAAEDRWREVPGERLLAALRGKDVLVVFIESYGRTVLDDPRYAPPVTALLDRGTRNLAGAGISARSGFLTAPTVGGMSWLSHGTALSGLWVDNQRRYDSLVVSDRLTLNRAFRAAGWRTVAVMPAITLAWPEGAFYGYDRIYAAGDLGYRGKPFNWVTMPDQYVWSALRRLELAAAEPSGAPRRPVMAEIALISSHAPWTPVPHRIGWAEVGDGGAFNAMAASGDPPEVVWRDHDRVRRQFRESVEYALDVMVSYALTHGLENTVILALGDHQPAPLLTGVDAGRDVPVHLITDDPAVLAAIEHWNWTPGLLPAANAPVWPMSALRDRMLEAFSPGVERELQPANEAEAPS